MKFRQIVTFEDLLVVSVSSKQMAKFCQNLPFSLFLAVLDISQNVLR